ncbi:Predicted dehydrogenase [Kaistia soli DSM 19436]|uniref:Predicted dehydrogenase n=1 Tax=Kaistia soli DSM 19436 TaxID=1122133 RepID=A0A1M5PSS8_9HYPH|nr:Predicted dehydrogenase [Kaistia soli DSM 19436]
MYRTKHVEKLRVGLIGLGTVGQVVHLPVLGGLKDKFEVVAVCDVSARLVERVADAYQVEGRYTDHAAMLAAEKLDVVAVINSDEYHADCAVDALASGAHVLIEKPVCLSLADLDRIIAARDAAGKIAFVGYMRRFAGAYAAMKARLASGPSPLHVAVRDIIGPNAFFIGQTTVVEVGDDIAPSLIAERQERAESQVRAALGQVSSDAVSAYRLLCGLGSHDLSAMRGLIGAPKGVIGAGKKSGGRYVAAILDYGSFMATFEMGLDQVGRFDASIEAFTGSERLRIDYDTPFIRHLPTLLTVQSTEGDALSVAIERPSYRDPYTSEWLHFHDAITAGVPVDTTLEDAAEDLKLFADIIAAFPD